MCSKLCKIAISVIRGLEHGNCLVAVILILPVQDVRIPFSVLCDGPVHEAANTWHGLILCRETATKHRGAAALTHVGKDYETISQKFTLIQFIVKALERFNVLQPLGLRVLCVRIGSWRDTQRLHSLRQ